MLKPIPIPVDLTDVEIGRFWAQVEWSWASEISVLKDLCWRWNGNVTACGYGKVTIRKRSYPSHRVSYFLYNGHDLGEDLGCHSCDNPPCCNPTHIFPGTAKQNTRDMILKGRATHGDKHWTHVHPEKVPRGDQHPYRIHPEYVKRGADHCWSKHPELCVHLPHGDQHWTHIRNESSIDGVKNPHAILTPSQVREIRERWSPRRVTKRMLAEEYGVCSSTIDRIVRWQIWREIS